MSTKFQQLFLQLMEDNSAAPGGAFGPNDAWSSKNITNKEKKTTKYVLNWGKGKKEKKKKFPLIKRNLNRSL